MFKGYKTIIFNVLAAVLPIMEATDLTAVLSENGLVWYGLVIAVGNVILRTVTTTPVGKAHA